jgi:NADPH2:quinone reductase
MRLEDVEAADPPPGHARVRVEAAGVNFIDVYHRTGLYPQPLPFTPGLEGAGVVESVGEGVRGPSAGARVAFANVPGAYAEKVVALADRLVTIPERVETRTAAAAMLQGMTAHYLVHTTGDLKRGDTCLVHAAAGGAGLLLVQTAKKRGARVIGTVSNEEKARLAREAGADEVILYTSQDFVAEVKRATEGKGVRVVYDSVGQATFAGSLDCLAPLGMMVLFGQSSGPVPPFNPSILSAKGSLFLTRPKLFDYVADRPSLERRAADVLGWIADGSLKIRIHGTYPLAEAADAHRALEGRLTSGKLLLLP